VHFSPGHEYAHMQTAQWQNWPVSHSDFTEQNLAFQIIRNAACAILSHVLEWIYDSETDNLCYKFWQDDRRPEHYFTTCTIHRYETDQYVISGPSTQWASILWTDMSLAGAWKQLWCNSGCGQGLEDCSRRMDQQWQKQGGGRTCWVGNVVCAVDFAQQNKDVSGSVSGMQYLGN